LVPHRYEALLIFGPDTELLNCPRLGRSRVRRINEADKGRFRSSEAADLPSGDAPPANTEWKSERFVLAVAEL
jgi:hypothetical protein